MTTWIVVLLAGLLGLFIVYRWARSLPVARAWDPNSHDKMTSYALDLLEQEEKPTLFGWLLQLSRRDPLARHFQHAIETQIRRGSVEEDMNSHLLTRVLFTGLTILGKEIMASQMDSLEGANGAYHFLNPNRTGSRGLTDSTFFLTLLGQNISGCNPPMPSAAVRAFAGPRIEVDQGRWIYTAPGDGLGYNWHLDTEHRNYSLAESVAYFSSGYSHLGFYAIGRICHLLQDMAVPAHVRDDAHPGGCFEKQGADPSDPLEFLADLLDVPVGGMPDSPHKWAFDYRRVYDSGHQHTCLDGSRVSILEESQEVYRNYQGDLTIPDNSFFLRLAGLTYHRHYSYNTIPGNANSHDPDHPQVKPLARAAPVDWRQCAPNPDAFYELCRLFLQEAGDIFFPKTASFSMPSFQFLDAQQKCQPKVTLLGNLLLEIQSISTAYNTIMGIYPKQLFPTETLKSIVEIIVDLYQYVKVIDDYLQSEILANPLKSVVADPEVLSKKMALSRFVTRYQQLDLPLLLAQFDAADPSPLPEDPVIDTTAARVLRRWIHVHPSPKDLGEAFTTREKKFNREDPTFLKSAIFNESIVNGPCCLTARIIEKQWVECQAHGVAFTAMLLASWFEHLFTARHLPAVEVWLNQDPGDLLELAKVQPTADPAPGPQTFTAKKTACLGLSNRFPVPLEMVMEIEVVEDEEFTDPDLLEAGVELDLVWDLLRAQNLETKGFWEQFPKTSGHFLSNDLKAYLANRSTFSQGCQSFDLGSITLGGKDGESRKHTVPLGEMEPFHLLNLCRYPLAQGKWSPKETDMGGITREDETNPELFQPLGVSQDGQFINELLSAGLLRLSPRVQGEAKPASGAPATGSGPAQEEKP